MVNEVEVGVAVAPPTDDVYQEALQAFQETQETMRLLLIGAAALGRVPGQEAATFRRLALTDWSALLADLQLIRSLAIEKLVHIAYVADDPEIRASARKGLVDRGLAAPLDFDRRSCAEMLAALPATLAAQGLPAPGPVA